MNFDSFIEKERTCIIETTQQLIRLESEKAKPCGSGAPFGRGVANALHYALECGAKMGFEVKNGNGYYGYIEYGTGNEMVGITAHLDVVPAGNGWKYPPYAAEIHEGRIYGRGAIDDKGPAVAALYAIYALQQSGVALNKRVRLILGCDEESGWACMDAYKEYEASPDVSFSPDAVYPLIFAEKGIVNMRFTAALAKNNGSAPLEIIKVSGGSRANVVPETAYAELRCVDEQVYAVVAHIIAKFGEKAACRREGGRLVIETYGVGAHGSLPELGVNAISELMEVLFDIYAELGIYCPILDFYHQNIGMEYNGCRLGCAEQDEISGALTFNVGTINWQDGAFDLVSNIRYPITADYEKLVLKLRQKAALFGLEVNAEHHQKPLYVSKDTPLVKTLLEVYREYTNDNSEPLAIGGGTYARAFANSVAFGAVFPGEPDLAHQRDEYIDIENLILNAKIIAEAVYRLAK